MVSLGDYFFRNIFYECLFGGEGCLAPGGETYAFAHAKHMGVNRHGSPVEHNGENDVGSLASREEP